jgi:hypothetical protein
MTAFLLSPEGALSLAALTTLLAWAESDRLPWAPFLILYAIALPLPPLWAGTTRWGSLAEPFRAHAPEIAVFALLILAWEIGLMGIVYEKALRRTLAGPALPRWSPAAAMEALLASVSERHRLPPKAVQAWYGFYFLIWAPVAEESFFGDTCTRRSGPAYPPSPPPWSWPSGSGSGTASISCFPPVHTPGPPPWP